MKRSIKTKTIAAFTFASLLSLFSNEHASATILPITQISGGLYYSSLAAVTTKVLAEAGNLSGVATLVSLAANDLSQAFRSIDVAALTPPKQAEQTTWTPETTASIRPAAPKPAARSSGAVFGTVAIPFKRLAALKRFAPALEEMKDGTAITCDAKACAEATAAIKVAFTRTAQSSIRDKLNAVNATVNHSIRYRRDIDTYKVADYWATPAETLSHQQGDCEDFAILKMAALHAEGVDLADMSIVVLFDQKRHFYHAILSVAVNGRYFILDNMRDEVLPDSRLPDYLPLYSIAGGKGYLHGSLVPNQAMAANMPPLEKVAPGEGVTF